MVSSAGRPTKSHAVFSMQHSVDQERAILKALGKARPGVAESFQWVNLLGGDTMLMSVTNHRYLAAAPDAPGPVSVTALGASADDLARRLAEEN